MREMCGHALPGPGGGHSGFYMFVVKCTPSGRANVAARIRSELPCLRTCSVCPGISVKLSPALKVLSTPSVFTTTCPWSTVITPGPPTRCLVVWEPGAKSSTCWTRLYGPLTPGESRVKLYRVLLSDAGAGLPATGKVGLPPCGTVNATTTIASPDPAFTA